MMLDFLMEHKDTFKFGALIAGFIVPLFNIPGIIKIIKRKSADDLSLLSFSGFMLCTIIIEPWAIVSGDTPLLVLNSMNLLFLTIIICITIYFQKFYRGKKIGEEGDK